MPVSLQRWSSLSVVRAKQGQKESREEQEHQKSVRSIFPSAQRRLPSCLTIAVVPAKRLKWTLPQVKG